MVLPVLLMLSLGGAQYGYFMYVKNTLQGAAQAGARAALPSAATNASVVGPGGIVTTMMSAAGFPSSNYTVTLSPPDVNNVAAGAQLKVTVTATWGTIGPQILSLGMGGIPSGKVVTGVAVVQKEGS